MDGYGASCTMIKNQTGKLLKLKEKSWDYAELIKEILTRFLQMVYWKTPEMFDDIHEITDYTGNLVLQSWTTPSREPKYSTLRNGNRIKTYFML